MKRIAAFALLALTLAACSSSTHHTAAPIASVAPTTTTVDPTVIPPVISVEYLNAVLSRLNRVQGDAIRIVVSTGQLPVQATDRIRALYNDPLYTRELRVLSEELGQGFANVKHPPGDRVMNVLRILTSSGSCVWLQTQTDYSAATITPDNTVGSEYVALRTKQPGIDPSDFNDTPWAFDESDTSASAMPPPQDPCA